MSSSSERISLASLPHELAVAVFEACVDRIAVPFDGRDGQLLFNEARYTPLPALCLLCQRLLPAAQAVLYDTISGLTLATSRRVLRTLDAAPALARLVRRLGLGVQDTGDALDTDDDGIHAVSARMAARLLRHLGQLQHFEVWVPDGEALGPFVEDQMAMPPITRLDVSLSHSMLVDSETVDAIMRLASMPASSVESVRIGRSNPVFANGAVDRAPATLSLPAMPRLRRVHWHDGPQSVVVALLCAARQPVALVSNAIIPNMTGHEAAASRVRSMDVYTTKTSRFKAVS